MSVEVLSDAIWALLALVTLATVGVAHLERARLARLSAVVSWLESRRLVYVAVLLAWAWAGWHFFAR